MSKSAWWGTQTQLHCCLMPQKDLESGKYYADCKVKKETWTSGEDKVDQEVAKLWEMSEEMVKDFA